jgi:histone H3/H4
MAKKAKKATKKKAAKKRSAPKSKEMLLVASKVKSALRDHDVNVASDAPEALNEVIHWYCEQAVRRANANGRKTVRAHDFMV